MKEYGRGRKVGGEREVGPGSRLKIKFKKGQLDSLQATLMMRRDHFSNCCLSETTFKHSQAERSREAQLVTRIKKKRKEKKKTLRIYTQFNTESHKRKDRYSISNHHSYFYTRNE